MTRAERLELALIPLAAAAAWGMAARLPDAPGLGDPLLAGAVLLLLQGLLRDLWLLWRRRTLAATAQPRRMPCLCLESALGTTGVLGTGGEVAPAPASPTAPPVALHLNGWVLAVALIALGMAALA